MKTRGRRGKETKVKELHNGTRSSLKGPHTLSASSVDVAKNRGANGRLKSWSSI